MTKVENEEIVCVIETDTSELKNRAIIAWDSDSGLEVGENPIVEKKLSNSSVGKGCSEIEILKSELENQLDSNAKNHTINENIIEIGLKNLEKKCSNSSMDGLKKDVKRTDSSNSQESDFSKKVLKNDSSNSLSVGAVKNNLRKTDSSNSQSSDIIARRSDSSSSQTEILKNDLKGTESSNSQAAAKRSDSSSSQTEILRKDSKRNDSSNSPAAGAVQNNLKPTESSNSQSTDLARRSDSSSSQTEILKNNLKRTDSSNSPAAADAVQNNLKRTESSNSQSTDIARRSDSSSSQTEILKNDLKRTDSSNCQAVDIVRSNSKRTGSLSSQVTAILLGTAESSISQASDIFRSDSNNLEDFDDVFLDDEEDVSDAEKTEIKRFFEVKDNVLKAQGSIKSNRTKERMRRVSQTQFEDNFQQILSQLPEHPSRHEGKCFPLARESDVMVCFVQESQNFMNKILNLNMLRRWEYHHLVLTNVAIVSKEGVGCFKFPLRYTIIREICAMRRWDSVLHMLRLLVPHGTYLFGMKNAHSRDQWYMTLQWKRNISKYQRILSGNTRPEVVFKELCSMVEYVVGTPLHDGEISSLPFEIVSKLLNQMWGYRINQDFGEHLIWIVSPILDNRSPTEEMCLLFSNHCQMYPRSAVIANALYPSVVYILKHNVDFGKHTYIRKFVRDYIAALGSCNNSKEVIYNFVKKVHGDSIICPHIRVLPNLVAICLNGLFYCFEESTKYGKNSNKNVSRLNSDEAAGCTYTCYLNVLKFISEYDDWIPELAALLHPVPIPSKAFASSHFVSNMSTILRNISSDARCVSHSKVLGVREGKDGWFDIYCPINPTCHDEGDLWALMFDNLFNCCYKKQKYILKALSGKKLQACLFLALRDHHSAQQALCQMLEWNIIDCENEELVQTIALTLQSTPNGNKLYAELQPKPQDTPLSGSPIKLSLPARSLDSDLTKLLSGRSFCNLKQLTLAFTHVTGASAELIIKLPALTHLNLWSTQFDDLGLAIICDHMTNLESLNLCETLISDEGFKPISRLVNLTELNLNSTKLTARTLHFLKSSLPKLERLDVNYTDT